MIKVRYRFLLLGILIFSIGCGAAPEGAAEREFSLDPASIETTPLPTPTEIPAVEESYPVATAASEPDAAYPVESVPVTTEDAYPVDDESMSENSADADVTFVRVVETAANTFTFHVTVAHPDTGWEDYADGWDVVLPDGTVVKANTDDLFTRLLLHPHETEQPFTRNQANLVIPSDVTQVSVRAHDIVDGFGGAEVVVDLTVDEGLNFSVER